MDQGPQGSAASRMFVRLEVLRVWDQRLAVTSQGVLQTGLTESVQVQQFVFAQSRVYLKGNRGISSLMNFGLYMQKPKDKGSSTRSQARAWERVLNEFLAFVARYQAPAWLTGY